MDIEKTVKDALGEGVVRVDQTFDRNRDGEPIVRVKVVLEESRKHMPGMVLLELAEQLRRQIIEEGNGEFPILSYVTESEDDGVFAA